MTEVSLCCCLGVLYRSLNIVDRTLNILRSLLYPVIASATVLPVIRWEEDYYLFFFGCISFFAAIIGRTFISRRMRHWVEIHILGMGSSYFFLLIVFYVDNGKNLPIWRALHYSFYWLLPSVVGVPIILFALVQYTRTNKQLLP